MLASKWVVRDFLTGVFEPFPHGAWVVGMKMQSMECNFIVTSQASSLGIHLQSHRGEKLDKCNQIGAGSVLKSVVVLTFAFLSICISFVFRDKYGWSGGRGQCGDVCGRVGLWSL